MGKILLFKKNSLVNEDKAVWFNKYSLQFNVDSIFHFNLLLKP